eukprot:403334310
MNQNISFLNGAQQQQQQQQQAANPLINQSNQLNRQQVHQFRPGMPSNIPASPMGQQNGIHNNNSFAAKQQQFMNFQRAQGNAVNSQHLLNPAQKLQQQPPTEVCQRHNEANVAFNQKNGEILCNTCIFEKKVAELKFTAVVVKEIKERFGKEFEKYKQSMNHMGDTDPQLVKQQIQLSVQQFFGTLRQKVADLHKNVMLQIQGSESLKNLEKVLEENQEFFTDQRKPDQFEDEKKKFDEKINKGRFAYVVKRQDFYKSLLESLDKSRAKMRQTIDQSMDYQSRILRVDQNERLINDKLGDIMRECIQVDTAFVEPGQGFSLQRSHTVPNQNNQQILQQNQVQNGMNGQHVNGLRPPVQQQQQQQQQPQYHPHIHQQTSASPQRMQIDQQPNMSPMSRPLIINGQQQQQVPPQVNPMQQQQQQQQMQQQMMLQRQQQMQQQQQQAQQQLQNQAQQQVNRPPGIQQQLPGQQQVQQQPPYQQQQQPQLFPQNGQNNFNPQTAPQLNANQRPLVNQQHQLPPSALLNQAQQQQQQVQMQQQVPQQLVHPPQAQAPQIINQASPIQRSPVLQQQQPPQVQHQNDDLMIVSGPQLPEHQFKTFYKYKQMNILKLVPGQGWIKLAECQNILLAKLVFTMDDKVYIIGGAKDQKAKETLADVTEFNYDQTQNQLLPTAMPKMITSRASFGCVFSVQRNEIYVVGGYEFGEITKKCEKFSIAEKRWIPMPTLQEGRCSSSLTILDNRYLYSIGGISKSDSIVTVLSTIERLDLNDPNGQWQVLPMRLQEGGCDIGSLPISKDEILIYGGWNKNPLQGSWIIKKTDQSNGASIHQIKALVESGINRPDFFMLNGIAMKTQDPNIVKVCGHTQLFSFDLNQRKFIDSSSI